MLRGNLARAQMDHILQALRQGLHRAGRPGRHQPLVIRLVDGRRRRRQHPQRQATYSARCGSGRKPALDLPGQQEPLLGLVWVDCFARSAVAVMHRSVQVEMQQHQQQQQRRSRHGAKAVQASSLHEELHLGSHPRTTSQMMPLLRVGSHHQVAQVLQLRRYPPQGPADSYSG